MRVQKTCDSLPLRSDAHLTVMDDHPSTGAEDRSTPGFQKIFVNIKALWIKASVAWARAAEIQRRIDEARAEQIRKFGNVRRDI